MSHKSQGNLGWCLLLILVAMLIACFYNILFPEHKPVQVAKVQHQYQFHDLPHVADVSFKAAWSAIDKPVMTKRQAQAILYVFGE